jgi:hypothetical protein
MNKGRRQELKSGDEVDAVYCRRWYNWKPKTVKLIKRAMNKRARKYNKHLASASFS